ncbi:type 1 glutamine amidotransferase domain-containing protein [Mycobacterium tilburgii]|uniref:type 1 glutamine amidotransferase domain-containing protein n=1 Tax=Mycobacterium tilburgii TaxID=44467 RepID=UPI0021B38264|nr:type 1 glutamine amidotransferase domain-containing protein [Mycobacterium tilburgii]
MVPLPDRDFDPTEVAVSWRVLTNGGHDVIFATESGTAGGADDIMVTGRGLDVWSALPVLTFSSWSCLRYAPTGLLATPMLRWCVPTSSVTRSAA